MNIVKEKQNTWERSSVWEPRTTLGYKTFKCIYVSDEQAFHWVAFNSPPPCSACISLKKKGFEHTEEGSVIVIEPTQGWLHFCKQQLHHKMVRYSCLTATRPGLCPAFSPGLILTRWEATELKECHYKIKEDIQGKLSERARLLRQPWK